MRHLLIGLCLLLACKPDNDAERPAWLLTEAKMVRLQADMHTLEARIQIQRPDFAKGKPLFDKEMQKICIASGTDSSHYRRSFTWYATRPALMDDIYRQVVDSLNVRESRARKK